MLDVEELARLASVVAGPGSTAVFTPTQVGGSVTALRPAAVEASGADVGSGHVEVPSDDVVLGATHRARRAEIEVVPASIVDVLERLRGEGYTMLMSVHGVDYYPEEPRLGVVYELLSFEHQRRISVKLRVTVEEPTVPSVAPTWPTANFHEREVFDMFGVVFDGHPDLRRILMPDDYIGHPQRRDFPIGGEPVLFTGNEDGNPGWWK